MDAQLTALLINCTLKPAPEASSSEVLGRQVLDALAGRGVAVDELRAVDHDTRPGVQADMGEGGDAWPGIRQRILDADILVLATPTWLGQRPASPSGCWNASTPNSERPTSSAVPAFSIASLSPSWSATRTAPTTSPRSSSSAERRRFTVPPAQGSVYWNGEAMQKTDYKNLGQVPSKVAAATATAAQNAADLAALLHRTGYPA